ncbi:MAG: rhodanese-like domain-containing protein [Arenicellales bacterium]
MSSAVSRPPAATSAEAIKHFTHLLSVETDCWDTHHAISNGRQDFILLDVRSEEAYQAGHLAEAVSFPHHKINANNMMDFPKNTLFVVYCTGPHCNGADKAALKLARLSLPVKKMIGGVTGWADEGFELIK